MAKPSERTGKLWLRLLCLSTAKPSEQTGKLIEMIKIRWSYCPLRVYLHAVCFDEFVRIVRTQENHTNGRAEIFITASHHKRPEVGVRGGEGRARAEPRALLNYDAARPPEGGPAEVGDLTTSNLPLLDCACTSGRAKIFLSASHQTGLDTKSMTRRSIKVGIRRGGGQARAEARAQPKPGALRSHVCLCWSVPVLNVWRKGLTAITRECCE